MSAERAVCDECGVEMPVQVVVPTQALSEASTDAFVAGHIQCDTCKAAPRPRTSGNADEYRSPMQSAGGGGWSARSSGHGGRDGSRGSTSARAEHRSSSRDRRRGAPRARVEGDGQYRAPGFGGQMTVAGASVAHPRPGPKRAREGGASKPAGPSFAIKCTSCGADARVPFEPTPGRDVFCSDCFRDRRKAR
jgi:CxxC-x17-CxxC domain-containing protein